MIGTSNITGRLISARERISQSIADILTTPIGSRLLRGDYGSMIFDLIDSPGNAAGLQRLRAATVDAIKRWEPDVKVSRVDLYWTAAGALTIEVIGSAVGEEISASVTLEGSAA